MGVVDPLVVPRVPLPDTEPMPTRPRTPQYDEVVPGDLQVGSYGVIVWRDKPIRRRRGKRFPFGFRAPEAGA